MRALRKGQDESFYYGHPLGEMRLASRVFEMYGLSITLKVHSSQTLHFYTQFRNFLNQPNNYPFIRLI